MQHFCGIFQASGAGEAASPSALSLPHPAPYSAGWCLARGGDGQPQPLFCDLDDLKVWASAGVISKWGLLRAREVAEGSALKMLGPSFPSPSLRSHEAMSAALPLPAIMCCLHTDPKTDS